MTATPDPCAAGRLQRVIAQACTGPKSAPIVSGWLPAAASQPEETIRRFSLSRDCNGIWRLAGSSDGCAPKFPDLATALDFARRTCDAEAATIEIWVDGLYICMHQPKGWPPSTCAPTRNLVV